MGGTSMSCVNPERFSNRLVGGFMAVGKQIQGAFSRGRTAPCAGNRFTLGRPGGIDLSNGRCGNVAPNCRLEVFLQDTVDRPVPVTAKPNKDCPAPGGGDLPLYLLRRWPIRRN